MKLEVDYIRELEIKMEVVDKLLRYLKLDILNDEEKQSIYDIVMTTRKTDLQKRRFNMFYNIGPNIKEHNTYKKIAEFYNCSIGAIRNSVMSGVNGLYNVNSEQFAILKKILAKYEK